MNRKIFTKVMVGVLIIGGVSGILLAKASTNYTSVNATVKDSSHFSEEFNSNSIDKSLWEISNDWSNKGVFDCTWRNDNVNFSDEKLNLSLNKDKFFSATKYSGAEIRSKDTFGYGNYEVSMKPAKNSGIVSSFFTYTGPSDGNPWDEIDIEFLGKDTTKVQFNYYTNGVGKHEFIYDLGFDASESYHTYSFEWKKNWIEWKVDGKAVHASDDNIPSHAGKVMMNIWNGKGVDEWLGAYDGKTGLTASYDTVSYTK